MENNDVRIILSLYPNGRGLGYVCLEMPQKVLESGVFTVAPMSNDKILEDVEKFMDFFKPKLVVTRDCESPGWWRSSRVRKLVTDISKLATERNLPIHQYTRQQIRFVFEQFGATSKYEIAQQLVRWIPELRVRAPKLREAWMNEDHNMGLFDALSLAVTHEYLTE